MPTCVSNPEGYIVSLLCTLKGNSCVLQVDFLPEYKIHPLLQKGSHSASRLPSTVTLAVSFPLLHDAGQSNGQYDPGQAAAKEWPAQLLQSGLAASVIRLNRHHIKVQSTHSLQACHSSLHLSVFLSPPESKQLLKILNNPHASIWGEE